MGRAKRICYLSPMRAAKVQASLRIRAVSPEPSLLAHTNSESRGTLRQKARSVAPLNGWACAVEICHDGMLEDTNSLDGAQIAFSRLFYFVSSGAPLGGSSIGSVSAWHASGPKLDPHVQHILSWRLGHEKNSTAILSLPLIQEKQLSATGERMCTKYW